MTKVCTITVNCDCEATTETPPSVSQSWLLTPQDYGAIGDGVADDTAAFQLFADAVISLQGRGLIPPKRYRINGTVTLSGNITNDFEKTVLFEAYGAVFLTDASENPFYITGWGNGCKLVWRGGAIWAHNSPTPEFGFKIRQSGHHVIEDVIFRSGSSPGQPQNATYVPISISQLVLTNQDTGSFWTHVKGCIFGSQRDSGAANNANWCGYGVSIRGAGNATTISDCQFERTQRPVLLTPDTNGYMANGVLVTGNHFENCQNGILVNGGGVANATAPGGLRINNNRAEKLPDSFFGITGTSGNHQFLSPPSMAFNQIDSATTYALYNPDARIVQNLDMPQRISGRAQITAANYADVVFASAGWGRTPSASYVVNLEPSSNQNFWVSNRTETGFRINSEVASTVNVGWTVTRNS